MLQKEGPEPSNFGFAPPGRLALESLDPDHKYTLLLSASDKNVEGGVEHYRKAELVQTDAKGTVSQHLVLYKSKSLETIDLERSSPTPIYPTKVQVEISEFGLCTRFFRNLRRFNQFHLAVFCAMQNHDLTLEIAEHKHVSIAELGFLDRFFDRQWSQRNRVGRLHQVGLGSARDRWKLMYNHRSGPFSGMFQQQSAKFLLQPLRSTSILAVASWFATGSYI